MNCTACDDDCEAEFTCLYCLERKNVCHNLVGGFDADEMICSICHLKKHTGLTPSELRTLMKAGGTRGYYRREDKLKEDK